MGSHNLASLKDLAVHCGVSALSAWMFPDSFVGATMTCGAPSNSLGSTRESGDSAAAQAFTSAVARDYRIVRNWSRYPEHANARQELIRRQWNSESASPTGIFGDLWGTARPEHWPRSREAGIRQLLLTDKLRDDIGGLALLDDKRLEALLPELLESAGFNVLSVRDTYQSDGGVDIVASRETPDGIVVIGIQCKPKHQYRTPTRPGKVREFITAVGHVGFSASTRSAFRRTPRRHLG